MRPRGSRSRPNDTSGKMNRGTPTGSSLVCSTNSHHDAPASIRARHLEDPLPDLSDRRPRMSRCFSWDSNGNAARGVWWIGVRFTGRFRDDCGGESVGSHRCLIPPMQCVSVDDLIGCRRRSTGWRRHRRNCWPYGSSYSRNACVTTARWCVFSI